MRANIQTAYIPVLLAILSLCSCSNLFSYSPYDADVTTKNLNATNLTALQSRAFVSGDTLRIAVISDPHNNYDELKAAITAINNMNGLSFVVCCGDITNWGTEDEFEWYWDRAGKSVNPLFTLIGNHDYLSNGNLIFARMFGATSYSFDYGGYHFVMFDNTVWENNNQTPDFEWLASQLAGDSKKVLFAHLPVWADQLEGTLSQTMDSVLTGKHLLTAIYGHNHDYEYKLRDGIPQYVVNDIDDRRFALLSLCGTQMKIQWIEF